MSAYLSIDEALALKSITVLITLTPRLARRPRTTAYDQRRSVDEIAEYLVVKGLVPDVQERRRLAEHDLGDVIGVEHRDDMTAREQA